MLKVLAFLRTSKKNHGLKKIDLLYTTKVGTLNSRHNDLDMYRRKCSEDIYNCQKSACVYEEPVDLNIKMTRILNGGN
jgi:hypothetical protein